MGKSRISRLSVFLCAAILLTSFLILAPPLASPVQADTHYVNTGGSIQAAVTAATENDTIVVAAGTYVEKVTITKTLTLNGANVGISAGAFPGPRGPESVIQGGVQIQANDVVFNGFKIDGPATSGQNDGIYIVGSTSGHTIANNVLVGLAGLPGHETPANQDGWAMEFSAGVSATTVSNNDIGYWWSTYINPTNSSANVLFEGNHFHNNYVGIGSDGLNDVIIRFNKFTSNTLEAIGSSVVGSNVRVNGNVFVGNGAGLNHYGGGQPIDATGNYWGDATGPHHDTLNPAGQGDAVGGPGITQLSDFQPWSVLGIASVNPTQGTQGDTLDNVIITGTALNAVTSLSFGAGINVNSFTADNSTQITANITIDPDATPGSRNVSVTTGSGETVSLSSAFLVNEYVAPSYSPTGWYEQFTGQLGSVSTAYVYGQNQVCQTFTPSKDHYFNSASLWLYRAGRPNFTVTISLYNAPAGQPTGAALCSTSLYAGYLSTVPYTWGTYLFTTGCQLSAGTEYALVISASGGTLSNLYNRVNLRTYATDGYSRGQLGNSTDAGASWLMNSGADMAFKEGQDTWHESQTSTTPGILVSGLNQAYQTFIPSRDHYLNYVSLYLYKVGYSTCTVTISLHEVTAGQPTGSALCSTTFLASSLTTKAAWRSYRFLSGYEVSASTTYALVISASGYGSVVIQTNTADGYNSGDCGRSIDGGASWQTLSGPDLAFREGDYPWYAASVYSNAWAYVYGQNQLCQTFTPSTSHYFDYLSLCLSRVGIPNYTVTISLHNVDENHQPTGTALCTTSFAASSLTLPGLSYSIYPWYEFRFATGCQLSAGTEYALVLSADGGDAANSVIMRVINRNYYAGGQRGSSIDAGATWQMLPTQDMAFMTGGAETAVQVGSGSYEQFTGQLGSVSTAYVYGQNQVCQTFTPSKDHYFNSASLWLYRAGRPNFTVTISLYNAPAGQPTGAALCSTSLYAGYLSTAPKTWSTYLFTTGCQLSAGTEYALVISASGGTLSNLYNRVNLRTYATDGYSRGQLGNSTDAGASWLMNSGADMAFKEGQDTWHESQTSTTPGILVSGLNQAYQTFIPSRDHYLNYVSLYLYKVGYSTCTVTISLHEVTAGQPTGSALCSTTFLASSLTTKAAWRSYRFLSGYEVSAGTTYALVISASGYGSVVVQTNTADGYNSGNCGRSIDGGTTWQTLSGPDLAFREGDYPWYTAFGSSNWAAYVYGQNQLCQTFTPSTSHYFEYVSLCLYRVGIPNYTVTISLYNVDENHQPTGTALRTTSFAASSLTLPILSRTAYPWYEFRFATGCQLSAGTEYALVLSGSGGDAANTVSVRINTRNYYAGGQRGSSIDAGATWQMLPTQDMTFMTGGMGQA